MVTNFYLEKAMAPHSSTLAWENPMDRGAWWATVNGVTKSRTRLSDFTFTFPCHALIGEGNGNPLQHSCLENPRDGGAWGLPSMGSHRVEHN